MSSTPRILCVGNIMVDVIAQLKGEIHFGGDTRATISTHGGGAAANVATWLSHIGSTVHLTARVGKDAYGSTILAELDSYGVEHKSIVADGATGTVIILVSPDGERTMFPDWACNSTIELRDLPTELDFDIALFSGYPLIDPQSRASAKEMLEQLNAAHIPIIFDPGTVGALKEVNMAEIHSWLHSMAGLIMNEEEARFLTKTSNLSDAMDSLVELVPLVVIKQGGEGALGQVRGSAPLHVDALPSQVVDATGAGDAFAAGFISAWATTPDLGPALQKGAEVAAIAVATVGARPPR